VRLAFILGFIACLIIGIQAVDEAGLLGGA
jgi:hypothetical protein